MNQYYLYLLIGIFFALSNVCMSIYYFIRIKVQWRYIKLFYATSNMFVLLMMWQALFNIKVPSQYQFLALIVLLSSQFSGLIVSMSKLKLIEKLDSIKKEVASQPEPTK